MTICDRCHEGTMVRRNGPHGAFLGCDRFPACRNSRTLTIEVTDFEPLPKDPGTYVLEDVGDGVLEVVEDDWFEGPDECDFDEDYAIQRAERDYEAYLDRMW